MATFEGSLLAPGGRFAVVASRFNRLVVDQLVEGARAAFRQHGVADEAIDLAWVPGAVELPLVARKLAESGRYEAVVCLGCVIRGETDHHEHVAGAAANGVQQVALATGVPTIFGVLTCATLEQALQRAGGKTGNKGSDAALAALEMANLIKQLEARRE
jgi:6,7-dimethyl-8-ribityllumazine synthase